MLLLKLLLYLYLTAAVPQSSVLQKMHNLTYHNSVVYLSPQIKEEHPECGTTLVIIAVIEVLFLGGSANV